MYDRLYDIVNLTVIADKNTVGYYDMNSQVRVARRETGGSDGREPV